MHWLSIIASFPLPFNQILQIDRIRLISILLFTPLTKSIVYDFDKWYPIRSICIRRYFGSVFWSLMYHYVMQLSESVSDSDTFDEIITWYTCWVWTVTISLVKTFYSILSDYPTVLYIFTVTKWLVLEWSYLQIIPDYDTIDFRDRTWCYEYRNTHSRIKLIQMHAITSGWLWNGWIHVPDKTCKKWTGFVTCRTN